MTHGTTFRTVFGLFARYGIVDPRQAVAIGQMSAVPLFEQNFLTRSL
jgi:hypothetical protein